MINIKIISYLRISEDSLVESVNDSFYIFSWIFSVEAEINSVDFHFLL